MNICMTDTYGRKKIQLTEKSEINAKFYKEFQACKRDVCLCTKSIKGKYRN